MDALQFNDYGLLEPGVHACTLDELGEQLGSFQNSDRRSTLFSRLREFLKVCSQTGVKVIIDGSFVMKCVDTPDDIDLLLILPEGWDWSQELVPRDYNVLSSKNAKSVYRFDVKVAPANSEAEQRWLDFFAQVNPKWSKILEKALPETKGLIEVQR